MLIVRACLGAQTCIHAKANTLSVSNLVVVLFSQINFSRTYFSHLKMTIIVRTNFSCIPILVTYQF